MAAALGTRRSAAPFQKTFGNPEPGDIISVTRRDTVVDEGGRLSLTPETLDEARRLAPGADIYALEAEWQAFAARTPPRNADKAFLGWVASKMN